MLIKITSLNRQRRKKICLFERCSSESEAKLERSIAKRSMSEANTKRRYA